MSRRENGTTIAIYLSNETLRLISGLSEAQRRSRSNMIEVLVRQGLTHPRISELATAYLLGYVGADEAMREIATLILAPSAVDERQLKLELPTPA